MPPRAKLPISKCLQRASSYSLKSLFNLENLPRSPHASLCLCRPREARTDVAITGGGRTCKGPAGSRAPGGGQGPGGAPGMSDADAQRSRELLGTEFRDLNKPFSVLCSRSGPQSSCSRGSFSAARRRGCRARGDVALRASINVTGQDGKCLNAKSKMKTQKSLDPLWRLHISVMGLLDRNVCLQEQKSHSGPEAHVRRSPPSLVGTWP